MIVMRCTIYSRAEGLGGWCVKREVCDISLCVTSTIFLNTLHANFLSANWIIISGKQAAVIVDSSIIKHGRVSVFGWCSDFSNSEIAKKTSKASSKRSEQPVQDSIDVTEQVDVLEVRSKSRQEVEQAFDAAYLQQTSKEFADDLEKLRTANDFKGERSVQLLVAALRQGTSSYNQDEKRRVVRG